MNRSGRGCFTKGLATTLLALAASVHAQNPAPLIVDGDGDGVSDEMDDCPYTPPHTPVDARGCPVQGDADGDGVPDAIDDCPFTPKGARVDAHGCALDSDFDGVPDGIDQCPNTPLGERVDETGCMPGERPGRQKPPAAAAAPSSTAPAKPARAAPRSTTSRALDATLDAALSKEVPAADALPVPASPAAGAATPPAPATPASETPPPVIAETPAIQAPPAAVAPAPEAAATTIAQPPADALPPLPSALSATLVTVDFPPNSVELAEAGFAQLRETARRIQSTLAANPGTRVVVEGHSLKAESPGLDQKRASLVRAFLMSRGVFPDDVSVKSPTETTTKANGRQVRVRLVPPEASAP